MTGQIGTQATIHTSLKFSHSLPKDVYPSIFDWFFKHPVFERWYRREAEWQLHCVGGPGTGKTTLAVLLSKYLIKLPSPGSTVVISVFVQKEVQEYEIEFLEDVLVAIYNKLESSDNDIDDDSDELYEEYVQERFVNLEGCRVHRRVQLIRKAVHSRLSNLPESTRAYLILDGFDHCNSALKFLLESELSTLQERGLGIFITSRLAIFEQLEARCDHLNHDDAPDDDPIPEEDREVLDMCWLCETCKDVMCFTCRDAGRICERCGNNDALREPFDHINIQIFQISEIEMKRFVAWSLEREHGDLKLESSARKPPLSALGRSLRENHTTNEAQALVDRIVDVAFGNIALAKARLDLVNEAESIQSVEARRDQLPANIIAMFDAGLRRIEAQPPNQRDLGLKAIAAAGRDDTGVSVPLMQRLLHNSISVNTRSGEDIVEAANGFLIATTRHNPQKLVVYNMSFYYYVVQRYNVGIHRASSQLIEDNIRRKTSSYDTTSPLSEPKVRFEPLTISEEPTEITPYKLSRTTTALDPIEEAPSQAFILRKGTRAWH